MRLSVCLSVCVSVNKIRQKYLAHQDNFSGSLPSDPGLRPGSVVVERSPGMRKVCGSIPGRVKQKTLKFEVLLLCLALSTKELETVWPARS